MSSTPTSSHLGHGGVMRAMLRRELGLADEVERHVVGVQPGDVPEFPSRLGEGLECLQIGLFLVLHGDRDR